MNVQEKDITTKTVYRDNFIDRLCIAFLSRKMAKAVGKKSQFDGYDGFVDLSQEMMSGRNAQQQQDLVAKILQSVIPASVLSLLRRTIPANKWVCESNAWFAKKFFVWLVGECELREVEIESENGEVRSQLSGVHIKKCRYLEQSGCVGMCVNMCKLPTQKFFTESFGIPLTMTPDFEDLSCEMVFGQNPPPFEEEEASRQPCLGSLCPTAIKSSTCYKLASQGD